MGKFVDITGQRFGKAVVLEIKHGSGRGKNRIPTMCTCLCDCGKVFDVQKGSLTTGNTRSCGCLHSTRGGLSQHKLYDIHRRMLDRCYKETDKDYRWYGVKGIELCPEWKSDYLAFYNWSIANGYAEGLTIDRIDSTKNYEPSNCRWVTPKVQANNAAHNHYIEYKGERLTMSQWAERFGLNYSTMRERVRKGWPMERIEHEKAFVGKNQSFKGEFK